MKNAGAEGMTILELLIALVVITVALFALAYAQLGSLSTTAQARDISAAKEFANRTLETARNAIVADIDTNDNWNSYYLAVSGCKKVALPAAANTPNYCKGEMTSGIYSAQWVVGPLSDAVPIAVPDEGLLQLQMQVDWNRNGAKSLSFFDHITCGEIRLSLCPTPDDPTS